MVEYGIKLKGKLTHLLPDGIICESKEDGLTRIRHRFAFQKHNFLKGDLLEISFTNILDPIYVKSINNHPTKVWVINTELRFIGVINSVGYGGSFDLKELNEKESPFKRLVYRRETCWISNDRYLADLGDVMNLGDIIKVEIKKVI